MRIVLVLTALSMVTPAFAQPLSLVVENLSRDTIESITVFPDGADVSVGTYTVPMAPGQAGRIDLALGQCQPVEVLVKLKDNPAEFRPEVDLCVDPKLTVGE